MLEILTAWAVCDHCRKRIYLSKPSDWKDYATSWFCGILDEYCPTCCRKPEILAEIEIEQRLTAGFREEPALNEYPEFIGD